MVIAFLVFISCIPVAIAPIWYGSGNDTGLVGRWSCEGNFKDSSSQGNNGTQSGGVTITDGIKGRGCGFDGINDAINISKTAVASSNLSMFMWIRPTSMPVRMGLIDITVKNFFEVGNGRIEVYGYEFGTPQWVNGAAVTVNTWQHVGFTWNGTSLRIYQDGVDTGGSNALTGKMYYTGVESTIGARMIVSGDRWFNGSIDEVLVYNRTLSASEVLALYNTSRSYTLKFKSTPTKGLNDESGLVAKYTFDAKDGTTSATAPDTSGNGYTMTGMGAKLTNEGKFKEGYILANTGYAYTLGNNPNFNNSDWTVSAWLKYNAYTPSAPTIYSAISSDSLKGFLLYGGGQALYTRITNGTNYQLVSVTFPTANNLNQWYHFVGVYNATAKNFSAYRDGVLGGSALITTIANYMPDNGINDYIGAVSWGGTGFYFNGTIDEVRVYNRSLSTSEVAELYNGTKSNKIVFKSMPSITSLSNETPAPTSSNETGLVGWYQMENNANDISGQGNNGIVVGAVANVTGRWNNALNFTGNGKYINYSAPASLDIEQAGTISAWIKPLSRSAGGYAVLVRASGGNWEDERLFFGLRYATNWMQCALANGTSYVAPIDLVSHNLSKWYHVACTWNGTLISIYNDGVFTISSAYAFTPEMTGYSMYTSSNFGAWTSLEGAVDEIRIYNRSLSAAEIQELYSSKGLVGKWTFNADERNTTDTYDSSGYYNHGKITGAVLTNEGRFKEAMKFDGVNDNINVSSNLNFSSFSGLTIGVWAKYNGTTERDMISKAKAYNVDNAFRFYTKSGTAGFYIGNTTGGFPTAVYGAVSNDNKWHYHTAVWDKTNISIYTDGVYIQGFNSSSSIYNSPYSLFFGSASANTLFWEGNLDDVRIYNRALTATEISQLYNGTKSTKLVWKSVPG